ncbi:MAG: hypothetical protein ABSF28_27820 [Terracidiphilus sp.]
MTSPIPNPHIAVSMLAFFQGTQLNLFERFLTQAVAGIDSTSITSGMQNVAYVVLLVGFLWQLYQSALHGGDVRGLGTNLIKYIVTALVVMNYGTIFTTINQGFVNAGNWVSNASGAYNLFENWKNDLQTQYSQAGVQQLWGLITGSMAGLIDGLLIIVAYLLYPIVIVVFGFFYMFYGSVLYIFGPIVIALLPLGGANRIAKSYIENVFIWNSWPILYGGFGALLSAVQMGQVGQMLSQNDFLGGLGNLEGSFLIGIASIIYSLAIAVIPFIAKRIVSGDVGATAVALAGVAATAVTAGIAAGEGAAAGIAAAGTSASHGAETGSSAVSTAASAGRLTGSSAGSNQPASPQTLPATTSGSIGGSPTIDGHANQIRGAFSDVMGSDSSDGTAESEIAPAATSTETTSGANRESTGHSRTSAPARRGPSVHRYNIGTWGAYHAARITAQGLANVTKRSSEKD